MNEIIKQTEAEYFKSEGLSNSYLINFDKSPSHAKLGIKKTDAMNDGTICHKYILEPNEFWNKYYFMPESITSKVLKEYKELASKITDKELLKYDYKNILESISKNINSYELIDGLTMDYILNNSEKEISIFWEDEIEGQVVQKKGRVDIAFDAEKYNILFDLKKTTDCLDFAYSIKKYQYYRQASWYTAGYEKLTGKKTIFIFLTFEFTAPFGVKAYELNQDYLHHGEVANLGSVLKYLEWKSEGKPERVYKNGIETIEKPAWL